jgi:hypothetical protein
MKGTYKHELDQLEEDIDALRAEMCAAVRMREWNKVHEVMDQITSAKAARTELKDAMIEQARM